MRHTSKAALSLIMAVALSVSAFVVRGAFAANERFDRDTVKVAAPDDGALGVRALTFGRKAVAVSPFERDYAVYIPAKAVAELLGLVIEPKGGWFRFIYDGKLVFTVKNDGPFGGVLFEDDEYYVDLRGVFPPLGYDVEWLTRSASITPRSGVSFDFSSKTAANKTFFALNNDNPIFLTYYLNATFEEQSGNKEIVELAREITEGVEGDLLKARAIHDWVAGNVAYDSDADEKFLAGKRVKTDAATVLRLRHTICFGYAKLTTALLRAAGIPAKTVTGLAGAVLDLGDHGWTEAYCDGKWITIDATWDQGGSYAGGKLQRNPRLAGREFFNMSMTTLSRAHITTDYAGFVSIDEDELKKITGLK